MGSKKHRAWFQFILAYEIPRDICSLSRRLTSDCSSRKQYQLMFSHSVLLGKEYNQGLWGCTFFHKRSLVEITQDKVLQGPLYIHPIFAGRDQAQSLFLHCSISWPEEPRKYPQSHMDLFPDHRSLNNFSKNTFRENK